MMSLEDDEMDISYSDDVDMDEDFETDESYDGEDEEGQEEEVDNDDDDDESDIDDQEVLEDLRKIHPAEAKQKAEHISTERILSSKEIRRVKVAQMAKQLMAAQPKRMTRKDETTKEVVQSTLGSGERVRLEDIERIYKKPKHNKESRLSTVIEGREGRGKFGVKKPKLNEKASTSNRDKNRNKAFGMVKHKLKRHKRKKTFHEKQLELKQKLLNREKSMRK